MKKRAPVTLLRGGESLDSMSTINVGCRFALYNVGARTYHTGIGRWMQEAPILGNTGDPMSFNRYQYCGSDPANYSDPTGLTTISPKRGGCPDVDKLFAYLRNLFMYGGGGVGIFGGIPGALLGTGGGYLAYLAFRARYYDEWCAAETRRRAAGTWPDNLVVVPTYPSF